MIRALYPDGQEVILPDAEAETLQKAVGGWIEYLPEAFYGLVNHEVVINDGSFPSKDHDQPNEYAARVIGFDPKHQAPRGVVVLVPLEQPNHAEREHQESWFAALSVDPALVGYGEIIDYDDGTDE